MKPIFFFIFSIIAMQAQNFIPEKNILDALDNSNSESQYNLFIPLGHPYSYLIDCRLNLFRSDNGEWAIAGEKLGYNPRSGYVELEIYYYGNCLKELEEINGSYSNVKHVYPIDIKNFEATTDGESLKHDAKFWLVRGQQIPLLHNKQAYKKAGINLKEYEPDEIGLEEAARLAIINHRSLFRATDAELYKCIPDNLRKIMVLDEWYHKDYEQTIIISSESSFKNTYEFNKNIFEQQRISYETFVEMMKQQNKESKKANKDNYNNNRPSSYETWQLIAKVISQSNPVLYKPTLKSNTHWKNWPYSGSL